MDKQQKLSEVKVLIENLKTIEEFENPNKSSIPSFIFGFLPIVNIVNVYSCLRRRVASEGKSILYYIANIATLGGLLSGFFAVMCLRGSKNETLASSKYEVIYRQLMHLIKSLNRRHKTYVKDVLKSYDPKFKQLKVKYPDVNELNKNNVASEYGKLIDEIVLKLLETIRSFINDYDNTTISIFNELEKEAKKIK
jgi:hypothetical protein